MVVAVAADLVAHAFKNERAIVERIERRKRFLQRGGLGFLVRPEGGLHDAVGTEHDHQPLFSAFLVGKAKTGQIPNERESRRSKAQIANELASRVLNSHVIAPGKSDAP